MRLVAKPNLEKMARQVTRDFGSLAANARIRAEVPVGLRLDLPNPCHCGISLKSETVHHSPIITGSDSSVQQEKSRQRGLRPFRVCGNIEGLAATVAGDLGLWRSWERVCMACRRSGVRIPSGPPDSPFHPSGVFHRNATMRWPFTHYGRKAISYVRASFLLSYCLWEG